MGAFVGSRTCRLSLPDRFPNVRWFTFFQPRGFLSAHSNLLEQDMCQTRAGVPRSSLQGVFCLAHFSSCEKNPRKHEPVMTQH